MHELKEELHEDLIDAFENDDLSIVQRQESRIEALHKIMDGNKQLEKSSGVLNDEAKSDLEVRNINTKKYTEFQGNPLQCVLHNEFVSIANITADECDTNKMKSLADLSFALTDVGIDYNKHGDFRTTISIANCCWGLIDLMHGIADGLALGTAHTIDAVLHPLDTVKNVVSGIGAVGYGLAKILHICVDINTTMAIDEKKGKQKIDQCIFDMVKLLNALKQKLKTITPRSAGRQIATLSTEAYLQGKLIHSIGKFL